eukprot:TRINITY_DN1800_c0_g1_i2.p1 TRINITY_DN1800_c0_g1~~TRINITY_DN1800_c0_g1_i2.p1  ORF type:complete len:463 (-),score=99.52 TRINITY_DN1800_c0_g1_i2:67-1455(-)
MTLASIAYVLLLGVLGVLGFLVVGLLLLKVYYERQRFVYLCRKLPGPPAHWLFGNMRDTSPGHQNLIDNVNWMNKYGSGKLHCVWISFFVPVVLTTHPDTVKVILKLDTPKGIGYKMVEPWLGYSVLTSHGKVWKRKRKLVTPAFHFQILKSYMSIYESCCTILLDQWQDHADQYDDFDLFPSITNLTLDIIGFCAFGFDINAQQHKNQEYVDAVRALSSLTYVRGFNPLYYFDWIWQLSAPGRLFAKSTKIVHELPERVIGNRRKMLERGEETGFEVRGKRYTDLVGILLEARDADTDQPLESREIREEVDTFMFEGHDTTASGISWTLYHLAAHPDVQEKAYEEIDRVLGDKTCPAYEDLSSLPYMTCVLKESMRLFPPVPAIGRTLDQDLEMDGYVIPKGCQVEIMPYVSHRNPLVWDDPEVFDPYRFDATNPAIATRDPFAAIPFSAEIGRASCRERV